jgi:hypothetical protein
LGASCKRSPLWLRSTETTSAWVPREAAMPLTALASPVTARQPTTPVMAIFLTARRLTRSEITPVLFVSNSDTPLTGKLGWSARPSSIALWLILRKQMVGHPIRPIRQHRSACQGPLKHPEVRIDSAESAGAKGIPRPSELLNAVVDHDGDQAQGEGDHRHAD